MRAILTVVLFAVGCTAELDETVEEQQPFETAQTPSLPNGSTEYEVTRLSDGPFAFETPSFGGVITPRRFNEGSSLEKESVLLNTAEIPVRVVGSSTEIRSGSGSRYNYIISADVMTDEPVSAFEIRHSTYDIFGEHMENLVTTEAVDFLPGERQMDGVWRSFGSRIPYKHLTTVSYIYRVRFMDGSVWEADIEEIASVMVSLDLSRPAEAAPEASAPSDPTRGVE